MRTGHGDEGEIAQDQMSKAEQAAFLKCPCGKAKQSFAHDIVLKERPVAKRVLEAGMEHVARDNLQKC